MIAVGLVDPRTGFDAAAGFLCPALIDFQHKKIARLKVESSKAEADRMTEVEMDEEVRNFFFLLFFFPFFPSHN